MINIVNTKNYGNLKFNEKDIERFDDYYLVNATDNSNNVYSGITDLNFNEVRINKYTLFNDIEKVLVPYNIIVTKENDIYTSYSLENGFKEIIKPSNYIIDKVNGKNTKHKIKNQDIIKNRCAIIESSFYYFPIVKMISYAEAYDTLVEVAESRESATLFGYFNKKNKARTLKK